MAKVPSAVSVSSLASRIQNEKLGHVDSRLWRKEWHDGWVMFADLIAFASRAKRSESVVLNNILRFDRASEIVANWLPDIRVRRFSDATFAVSPTFHNAMAFAIAISHCCLAFNLEYMVRAKKRLFHHLIVPRVTLAKGRVLLLPETPTDDARFAGLDPKNVIAGSAVVDAYALEKTSAGGLITVGGDGLKELQTFGIRGSDGRAKNGLKQWLSRLQNDIARSNGEVFCVRGNLVDIPWLLMRPKQPDAGLIWASGPDADAALRAYLEVWASNMRSFYVPQEAASPLETAKHYACAQRHGVHCFQMTRGNAHPSYVEMTDVMGELPELPTDLAGSK